MITITVMGALGCCTTRNRRDTFDWVISAFMILCYDGNLNFDGFFFFFFLCVRAPNLTCADYYVDFKRKKKKPYSRRFAI